MNWEQFYKKQQIDFVDHVSEPSEWQHALANKINLRSPLSCLEAGCGFGVTSSLIDEKITNRVLLDLTPRAIEIARTIFLNKGENAHFLVGDLLSMGFKDNCFDIVFNAGVLEHMNFTERKKAIHEMIRVARPAGNVIVAIPNHYSVPYRYAYLYRKRKKQWPYPDEKKIFDFKEEVQSHPFVKSTQRETVSKSTSFSFLRRHQRIFFKVLNTWKNYEGYLTIIIITKKNAGEAVV